MFKNKVTIQEVENLINFSGKNSGIGDDIATLQTKGVTSLYNILCEKNYSYLADEVGMGKTYQGLGLVSLLLSKNKHARVLIIAPKEDVLDKWKRDYSHFINRNLINCNKKVFTEASANNKVIDFVNANTKSNISIIRLNSFSNILSNLSLSSETKFYKKDIDNRLEAKEIIIPKELKAKVISFSSKTQVIYYIGTVLNNLVKEYDLIVFDEAQNSRNENFATFLFNTMFGLHRHMWLEEIKELKGLEKFIKKKVNKVLFMSATPAHSCFDDIKKQLSFIEEDKIIIGEETKDLSNFMVRRLRRFEGQTKYDYREEISADVTKSISDSEKLFIALVQKELEETLSKEGTSGNKNIFKIGFLEAFESYESSEDKKLDNNNEDDDEEDRQKPEFTETDNNERQAPDKATMIKINKSFREELKNSSVKYPPHPKHSYLEADGEEIFKSSKVDKGIIFVRRLASVRELCRRLSTQYDKTMFNMISKMLGEEIKSEVRINRLLDHDDITQDDEPNDDEEPNNNEDDDYIKSAIIQNFAGKKKDKTNGDKFKINFNNNRGFSIFFEENYAKSYYEYIKPSISMDYATFINELVDDDFVDKVNELITEDVLKDKKKKTLKKTEVFNIINNMVLYKVNKENEELIELYDFHSSFYNISKAAKVNKADKKIDRENILEYLRIHSLWNEVYNNSGFGFLKFQGRLEKDQLRDREILKSVLSKSIRISDGIVYLTCSYINVKRNDGYNEKNNIEKMEMFVKEFVRLLDAPIAAKLNDRIIELIKEYEGVKKILISDDEYKKITWEESFTQLNNQYPVIGITGGNKSNKNSILKFNTPFFPDIIVCTDVLKEGIDLHMFCSKVYHYGLAWTPGDLEQRVGRVDRFLGKAHRGIKNQEKSKVEIIYPYMGNTIDEQQIIRVLRNKRMIEPKLDKGEHVKLSKIISTEDIQKVNIEELLKYDINGAVDPYPGDKHI
jgi:hypothetical protein